MAVPNDPSDIWANVQKGPGCWIWKGKRKDANGYGVFYMYNKEHMAHRIAYRVTFGKIPKGMLVCHKCDNPPCCRPDHLFLGTQKDNMQDAIRKGRMATGDRSGMRLHPEKTPKGEKNGRHKLKEPDVLKIIRFLRQRIPQRQLARRFKVSQHTIWKINTGHAWKHLRP